jgi:hypothetical protein
MALAHVRQSTDDREAALAAATPAADGWAMKERGWAD